MATHCKPNYRNLTYIFIINSPHFWQLKTFHQTHCIFKFLFQISLFDERKFLVKEKHEMLIDTKCQLKVLVNIFFKCTRGQGHSIRKTCTRWEGKHKVAFGNAHWSIKGLYWRALPFTLKKYLKAKEEELWKFKYYFTMQKYICIISKKNPL
jgi:hypothetical protein